MQKQAVELTDHPLSQDSHASVFTTPDVYQAAFLLTRGRKITRVRHRDRYQFCFDRTPELELDLSDFHANVKVGIRDLVSGVYAIKRLNARRRRQPTRRNARINQPKIRAGPTAWRKRVKFREIHPSNRA